jgi:hypothetical protein
VMDLIKRQMALNLKPALHPGAHGLQAQ